MNIINLIISPDYIHMLVRLAICMFVNWIITDRLYYQKSHRREFYFTFMLISIAIFFLVFFMIFVLEELKGKTGIGIGIGLFGIFSIMRYRTDSMPVREMTYLFVIIALSVVNALADTVTLAELLLTNGIVVVAIAVCEKRLRIHPCKLVQYDRIELIKPDRRADLIKDLEERLGLKVTKVDVGGVDMLRDMAIVKVFYEDAKGRADNTIEGMTKLKLEHMTKSLLTLALLLSPVLLYAQNADSGDDFGVWASVSADKKINKKWSVGAEAELRTRDDSKNVDRWSLGVAANYKLASWLKASVGYVFLYDNNQRISYFDETDDEVLDGDAEVGDPKKRGEYWGTRHRLNLSVTASQKFGNWKLSLRERWQYTYRPEYTVDERWSYVKQAWDGKEHTYSGKGKNVLRSRFQVEYDKRKAQLTPYASVELFNAWGLQKVRYTIGADWKISKQHTLGAYYRYQTVNDDDDSEPNRHIIGVSYQIKL